MTIKLKPIKRKTGDANIYCGPAALCAVTGKPYEEVRTMINNIRDRASNTAVKGMWPTELRRCLRRLGFYGVWWKPETERPTLAKFLRDRPKDMINQTLIIELTGHYVTVKGRKFIDNHTKVPVFIRQAPFRRKRVIRYLAVYK